jgi:hypothetical protein
MLLHVCTRHLFSNSIRPFCEDPQGVSGALPIIGVQENQISMATSMGVHTGNGEW